MARTTRSQQKHSDDTSLNPTTSSSPSKPKSLTKKRKRTSLAPPEEQPATKLARNDDVADRDIVEDKTLPDAVDQVQVDFQGAGDLPLDSQLAQQILDILELVDTQGLLDRVFPLPTNSSSSSVLPNLQSSSQPQSYSFRTLLKESSRHTLRVLRSAVQPLFPVFAQSRSRPSAPAAQQLKFCNLALSLLDQSSFHVPQSVLDFESLIPPKPGTRSIDASPTGSPVPSKPTPTDLLSSPDLKRKRKYALVQTLPSGEWWTSLNSDITSLSGDGSEFKNLPTAHAELVSVLPSASTPESSDPPIPTLGSLTRKLHTKKHILPGPRHLSTGSFLDYGPNASFAPSFEQDAVEVGRFTLGEVMWSRLTKRRTMLASKARTWRRLSTSSSIHMTDGTPDEGKPNGQGDDGTGPSEAKDIVMDSLVAPEHAASLREFMETLDLEEAIQELLDRNRQAIARLEALQSQRLGGENGGTSQVEVGSEEWDLAQGIADSLILLASLRPRSTKDSSPLVPAPDILRKLHRSLPSEPSEGWFGTLPPTNPTALRDDTTLQGKAGASLLVGGAGANTVPSVATPSVATTNANKPTAQPNYSNYSYPNFPGNQYRGTYAYTPTSNPYYPNAFAQAPGQPAQTPAQPSQATQAYVGQQQQYNSYGSWYNYQQHQTPGQQPATPTSLAASYASFFNSQQTQQQQQSAPRAVANTVTTGKAAGNWPATPTLPPHLRPAVTAQPPGTPTPAGQTNYYYPAAGAR